MMPRTHSSAFALLLLVLVARKAARAVRDGEKAIASQVEQQQQRQAQDPSGGTLHHAVLPSTSWPLRQSKALGISHCALPVRLSCWQAT